MLSSTNRLYSTSMIVSGRLRESPAQPFWGLGFPTQPERHLVSLPAKLRESGKLEDFRRFIDLDLPFVQRSPGQIRADPTIPSFGGRPPFPPFRCFESRGRPPQTMRVVGVSIIGGCGTFLSYQVPLGGRRDWRWSRSQHVSTDVDDFGAELEWPRTTLACVTLIF